MIRKISCFILLLSTLSCGSSSKITQSQSKIERRGTNETGILFITLYSTSIDYTINISKIDAILVDGKLKNLPITQGDFLCIIEKSKGGIDSIHFRNPLMAHYEEYNEDGSMKAVVVKLEKAETLIRTNYYGGPCTIKVFSLAPKQQLINIFKIR